MLQFSLPLLLLLKIFLTGNASCNDSHLLPFPSVLVAPESFFITLETNLDSKYLPIIIKVQRKWAPQGVDRIYSLLIDNYYNDAAFFRVVPDFVTQFGIAASPNETSKWDQSFPDDPVMLSNSIGTLSFATAGPDTRTTQLFINVRDNPSLDSQGFAPFAIVVSGFESVLALNNPTPGNTNGVSQLRYSKQGNEWLLEAYPDISLITCATYYVEPLYTGLPNMIIVQQNEATTATVEMRDLLNSGALRFNSSTTFSFRWPLVEMTTNLRNGDIYVISFTSENPGGVLYLFDRKLSLVHAWTKPPFSFFDLQFSESQAALYGILVTTTYGRVLSNFTVSQANDAITATELFTLPYMWYVNASSFDQSTNRYFALINNFPGFENSTLDQQVVVADFSVDISISPPAVTVQPLGGDGTIVQFVSYSAKLKTLFSLGLTKDLRPSFGRINLSDGVVTELVGDSTGLGVGVGTGPLFVDDKNENVYFFIQAATPLPAVPLWQLWRAAFSDLRFPVKLSELECSSISAAALIFADACNM